MFETARRRNVTLASVRFEPYYFEITKPLLNINSATAVGSNNYGESTSDEVDDARLAMKNGR